MVDSLLVLIDRSRTVPLLYIEVAKLVEQSKLVRDFGLSIEFAKHPFVLLDRLAELPFYLELTSFVFQFF